VTSARARGDAGAATTELVLVTPLLVVLLLFVVFCGRVAGAKGDVVGAARDAARAASIERDPDSARAAGEATAGEALQRQAIGCATLNTSVDVSNFGPGGTVTVTLSCSIRVSDLTLLALPGTKTLTSTVVEVIDVYRSG